MNNSFICGGDGQLIRLGMRACVYYGVRPHILGSSETSPVGNYLSTAFSPASFTVAPKVNGIVNWEDEKTLNELIKKVRPGSSVTIEWENIPVGVLEFLEKKGGLIARPNIQVVKAIQDRKTEKELISSALGTPVPYKIIETKEDIVSFMEQENCSGILKTRKGGYDGKGQWKIKNPDDIENVWQEAQQHIGNGGLILEKRIEHVAFETSMIVGIDVKGGMQSLGPIYNIHENGILRYSLSPAPIWDDMKQKIKEEGEKIALAVSKNTGGYVGILTIEFIIDTDGNIYTNEFAPRPHNSGHATLDSYSLSQNHLWIPAVTGLELSETPKLTRAILMENILTQQELARMIEREKEGLDVSWHPYNYQKVSENKIDPTNTDIRKVGHVNHGGGGIEKLTSSTLGYNQEEVKRVIKMILQR